MRKPTSLKEALIDILPNEIVQEMNRSFEVVGNIAICEIPEKCVKYETQIAQALLDLNPNITTILKKAGNHGGEFRTQNMQVIGGINSKIATYKENGITLELNVEEIYFSTKLSTERELLAKNIQPHSNVLVLFSGSGPYSFVISKHQPNISQLTSVEINPRGHEYALKNLNHNKNNLKKSQLFQKFYKIIKEHNLPLYDKHLIGNINALIYQFYNLDAKLFNPTLTILKNETIKKFNNEIFNHSYKSIYETLHTRDETEILIDCDLELNIKSVQLSLLLFPKKFSYIIKKNNQLYSIKTLHEKNYFFNFLNDTSKSVEELSKYDEIFMPLPKDAELFLDVAFSNANANCIIHMYDFVHENEFPHKSEDAIKQFAQKIGREVEVLQTRKVGQYSPRKYRVCCDFKILN